MICILSCTATCRSWSWTTLGLGLDTAGLGLGLGGAGLGLGLGHCWSWSWNFGLDYKTAENLDTYYVPKFTVASRGTPCDSTSSCLLLFLLPLSVCTHCMY